MLIISTEHKPLLKNTRPGSRLFKALLPPARPAQAIFLNEGGPGVFYQ